MDEVNKSGDHDDCEDCKRQRKENQQYIEVYNRMQTLRINAEKISSSVRRHQQAMEEVQQLSKSVDISINKLNKSLKDSDSKTIEILGYEIAANIIQKSAKDRLQQQKNYLKMYMNKMLYVSQFKNKKIDQQIDQKKHPFSLPKISEIKNIHSISKTSNFTDNFSTHKDTHTINNFENPRENFSTKWSFYKENNKQKYQSSLKPEKYRQMNLWLYQSQVMDEKYLRGTNLRFSKNIPLKSRKL